MSEQQTSSLADLIFAAQDLDRKAVLVPEWGQTVYVQQFSGIGRAMVEKAYEAHKGDGARVMCAIVAAGLVDKDGNRLFTAPDAVEKLMTKNLDVIQRLHLMVLDHNHASAKTQERAEGNSEGPPTASSS